MLDTNNKTLHTLLNLTIGSIITLPHIHTHYIPCHSLARKFKANLYFGYLLVVPLSWTCGGMAQACTYGLGVKGGLPFLVHVRTTGRRCLGTLVGMGGRGYEPVGGLGWTCRQGSGEGIGFAIGDKLPWGGFGEDLPAGVGTSRAKCFGRRGGVGNTCWQGL